MFTEGQFAINFSPRCLTLSVEGTFFTSMLRRRRLVSGKHMNITEVFSVSNHAIAVKPCK